MSSRALTKENLGIVDTLHYFEEVEALIYQSALKDRTDSRGVNLRAQLEDQGLKGEQLAAGLRTATRTREFSYEMATPALEDNGVPQPVLMIPSDPVRHLSERRGEATTSKRLPYKWEMLPLETKPLVRPRPAKPYRCLARCMKDSSEYCLTCWASPIDDCRWNYGTIVFTMIGLSWRDGTFRDAEGGVITVIWPFNYDLISLPLAEQIIAHACGLYSDLEVGMVRIRGWGFELGRRYQQIAAVGLEDGSFIAEGARPMTRYDCDEDDCAVIRRLSLASTAIMGSTNPAARRSAALSPIGSAGTATSIATVAAARQIARSHQDPLDRESGPDSFVSGQNGGKSRKPSAILSRAMFDSPKQVENIISSCRD